MFVVCFKGSLRFGDCLFFCVYTFVGKLIVDFFCRSLSEKTARQLLI